jgi:hypothetical protein
MPEYVREVGRGVLRFYATDMSWEPIVNENDFQFE